MRAGLACRRPACTNSSAWSHRRSRAGASALNPRAPEHATAVVIQVDTLAAPRRFRLTLATDVHVRKGAHVLVTGEAKGHVMEVDPQHLNTVVVDYHVGAVPAVAVDLPSPHWSENTQNRWGGGSYVAAWEGSRKVLWKDGQMTETHLEADPHEEGWTPVTADIPGSLSAAVETVLGRVGESDAQIDPQML